MDDEKRREHLKNKVLEVGAIMEGLNIFEARYVLQLCLETVQMITSIRNCDHEKEMGPVTKPDPYKE